jgi:hypothetical protein
VSGKNLQKKYLHTFFSRFYSAFGRIFSREVQKHYDSFFAGKTCRKLFTTKNRRGGKFQKLRYVLFLHFFIAFFGVSSYAEFKNFEDNRFFLDVRARRFFARTASDGPPDAAANGAAWRLTKAVRGVGPKAGRW